ncbi:MAG: 50S ribosomal protein L19 [Dehalococcoidia bacterium]|nr:50S ribosomal protein L19 [Dehalococcoidia bacterium]
MDAASAVLLEPNPNIASFGPGDQVKVSSRIREGTRERIQNFEGVVIRIHNSGPGSTFTVRRITHGVGVEKSFLYHSPLLEKVEVIRRGKVRRAKLFYLRGLTGKAARIKEKGWVSSKETAKE